MSRSGYDDDGDDILALGRWRAQVASAIRGKRGQTFLRELLAALDGMPDKRLIKNNLQADDGCMCTLGVIGKARGIDLAPLECPEDDYDYDHDKLGEAFGIASQLAREVMYENDEGHWRESSEERWHRMRAWVVRQIAEPTALA